MWNDIKPYWLGDAGCDLTKNDPSAQYTPTNPPPKYGSQAAIRARRAGRAGPPAPRTRRELRSADRM